MKVKFQEGKTLRYRFICEREIIIESNPGQSTQSAANKSTEKMDLVMSYTPIEINPAGLTTIKVLCEDVEIIKSRNTTKDAAEYFVGKSFNFTIDSSCRIEDYTELNELIKQAGEKAFSSETNSNRTKNPDMINDFIATQWFLWDSIASIPNELQDSTIGQEWKSKLSVPTPMVSRWAVIS